MCAHQRKRADSEVDIFCRVNPEMAVIHAATENGIIASDGHNSITIFDDVRKRNGALGTAAECEFFKEQIVTGPSQGQSNKGTEDQPPSPSRLRKGAITQE